MTQLEEFCKKLRRIGVLLDEDHYPSRGLHVEAAAEMLEWCRRCFADDGKYSFTGMRRTEHLDQLAAKVMDPKPQPVAVDAEDHRHDADEEETRKSEWLDSLEEPR